MCANSEGSGETARMRRHAWASDEIAPMRRLARAFAGCLCDKYHNLMSWLILSQVMYNLFIYLSQFIRLILITYYANSKGSGWAYASTQSCHSLRCSHTQSMELETASVLKPNLWRVDEKAIVRNRCSRIPHPAPDTERQRSTHN